MFVRPSGSSLSRAVNLHLSRSESSQKAIREHLYRVIQSEPKILHLVLMNESKTIFNISELEIGHQNITIAEDSCSGSALTEMSDVSHKR